MPPTDHRLIPTAEVPPLSEPTLNEVVRRFEEATQRLSGEMADLTRELREERRVTEATYLRKDVYEAHRAANERELSDLRDGVDELTEQRKVDQTWKRQQSLTLGVAVGGWLLTIALFLFTLVAR